MYTANSTPLLQIKQFEMKHRQGKALHAQMSRCNRALSVWLNIVAVNTINDPQAHYEMTAPLQCFACYVAFEVKASTA